MRGKPQDLIPPAGIRCTLERRGHQPGRMDGRSAPGFVTGGRYLLYGSGSCVLGYGWRREGKWPVCPELTARQITSPGYIGGLCPKRSTAVTGTRCSSTADRAGLVCDGVREMVEPHRSDNGAVSRLLPKGG